MLHFSNLVFRFIDGNCRKECWTMTKNTVARLCYCFPVVVEVRYKPNRETSHSESKGDSDFKSDQTDTSQKSDQPPINPEKKEPSKNVTFIKDLSELSLCNTNRR